jgi:F-type H+-transporting ATPase subunit delta
MARGGAKDPAIVHVWTDAIFGLAEKNGVADEMLEEWNGIVGLLDREPAIELVFASPLVDDDEKKALVEKAFRGKASDLLVDTLQVMRSKGRLGLARAVAASYRYAWLEKRGQVEVEVTSAAALTPEQRQSVGAAASKFAGRDAILIEKVNPALLGGFVLRAGDRKFDGSVAREVERFGENLRARASRELLSGREYINSEDTSRGV